MPNETTNHLRPRMNPSEFGDWLHRCYRARLAGEVARMDGIRLIANPFGSFHRSDDSPEAQIANDWQYGWEHQNCVESHRWISVKERLPEAGARVLLVAPGTFVTIGRLGTAWKDSDAAWIMDNLVPFSLSFYTHWMPLPEPPDA